MRSRQQGGGPKRAPNGVPLDKVFPGGSELAARMRAFDWSASPLGPLDSWPRSLVSYVGMLLELPSPAIIFWGPDQIQLYNDGYALIMGPRHPRYLAAPYRECWPDTYPMIYPWMQKVLAGDVVRVDHTHIPVTRYGFTEEAYFSFTFSPLRDDDGRIAGILQPVVEVTDAVLGQRRTETLHALAPRADSVNPLEDVAAALRTNDRCLPFFLIHLWNESSNGLDLAAHSDPAAPLEPVHPRLDDLARRAFDSGLIQTADAAEVGLGARPMGPWPEPIRTIVALPIPRAHLDSRRGVLLVGLSPRLRYDDTYRGFLELATRELAAAIETKRALQEARRRAETLAELDRAKTAFFSSVSHEFRTPLTLMLGPLEDALGAPARALTGANLETAYRNALRLLKLVNTLLDVSRLEAGRMPARFAPTDLAALTADLAALFRPMIERAGLELHVRCEPLPETVFVDREMWEKVVLNLLSNAFKFTFDGRIEVVLEAANGRVELRVRDTGTGLPADALPHIFERFHRVDGARSRTHEGSGIGLALVQELVRTHGGDVAVESVLGTGTTFTVTLPFGHGHLPADKVVDATVPGRSYANAAAYVDESARWLTGEIEAGATEPAPAPEAAARPSTERILVVDDNADMRSYIAGLLRDRWTVEVARDGVEALAALRSQPFDLVITDVMMPRLDGFGLVEAVKTDAALRPIPVLMLSARAGEEARVEGLQAGADDYLVKPFSARELLVRVKSQLTLAASVKESARLAAREQSARREAESASRAKDEFLAILGHELRNPLAPMVTALQLMRLRGLESRELDVLDRQVDHLTRLVDDLLDVRRIASGKVELRRRRVELAAIVIRAVETTSPALELRRQAVEVDVPTHGFAIDVDPDRMTQVFSNLLTNAAKYSELDSRIRIGALRTADHIRVSVADDGMGIAPEMIDTIFDMFVQQPQTLDRSTGGLGLGLTIVRSLVEMHGGRVSVHSAGAGRGSEFVIELPAAPEEADALTGRASASPAQVPAAPGRRILVVDDNEDAAEMLRYALGEVGHLVAVAHDGPTALDTAAAFTPEVAILDIGLPVMDGYELAQRLRAASDGRARLHLVAVTGYGQETDRRRAAAVGFDEHLVKPVSLEALRRVLDALASSDGGADGDV